MNENSSSSRPPRRGLRAVGPAIIVASVVIGPGSILSSSKVGIQHGYGMIWVTVLAGLLMVGMTALSARLGVMLKGTLCEELAQRSGRPLAIITGGSVFLIASCFQFGNNLGVLTSIEPFLDSPETPSTFSWPVVVLLVLNASIVATLLGMRRLYKPLERLMTILVVLMLIAFIGNLFFARPSLSGIIGGLVPKLPESTNGSDFSDVLLPIMGLVATTFSMAAAFYQSYLVREKGWSYDNLKQGLIDSIVGITILGSITIMIMITSAAVLHGRVDPASLKTAADVARQLEPAFGDLWATRLFCLGIFAGAFSSFLVNAMIGGTLLSDGLGLGGKMDGLWAKVFTVSVLLFGMVVAIFLKTAGISDVNLVIFAQALTVLAVPTLSISILYLATRADVKALNIIPAWMLILATLGCFATIVLALRTAWQVFDKTTA